MARTVLITGCSDGSLGAAASIALQKAGFRVFATARDPKKLGDVQAAGIETLCLDVLNDNSIAECVNQVRQLSGSLDILFNNAGSLYQATLADASVEKIKQVFDLNVHSILSVSQAFLPLLLKSENPLIVNHTSLASIFALPFNIPDCSSKAAAAMLTRGLRQELSPFGVKVMELKSGSIKSNGHANASTVPEVVNNSLYYPAREWVVKVLNGSVFSVNDIPAETWARQVVTAMSKSRPPLTLMIGPNVWLVSFATTFLPLSLQESLSSSVCGISTVEKNIREYGKEKAIANAYGP